MASPSDSLSSSTSLVETPARVTASTVTDSDSDSSSSSSGSAQQARPMDTEASQLNGFSFRMSIINLLYINTCIVLA